MGIITQVYLSPQLPMKKTDVMALGATLIVLFDLLDGDMFTPSPIKKVKWCLYVAYISLYLYDKYKERRR
ncbi:MAG: hypothetical protein RR203_02570 [Synergistaceae bacterium]